MLLFDYSHIIILKNKLKHCNHIVGHELNRNGYWRVLRPFCTAYGKVLFSLYTPYLVVMSFCFNWDYVLLSVTIQSNIHFVYFNLSNSSYLGT